MRLVCTNARVARAVADDRHGDRALNLGTDLPQRRGRRVADHGALTAGDDGRHRTSAEVVRGPAAQVHAPMQCVQQPALDPVLDRAPLRPDCHKLLPHDHAVLTSRDRADQPVDMNK